jgi:hypothetical protein
LTLTDISHLFIAGRRACTTLGAPRFACYNADHLRFNRIESREPEDFGAMIAAETKKWQTLVQFVGIGSE